MGTRVWVRSKPRTLRLVAGVIATAIVLVALDHAHDAAEAQSRTGAWNIITNAARGRSCGSVNSLVHIFSRSSYDPWTRAYAATAAGRANCSGGLPTRVQEALIDATAKTQPAIVRRAAIQALGRARAQLARQPLTSLLAAEPDATIRLLIAQSLAAITQDPNRLRDVVATAETEWRRRVASGGRIGP